MPQVYRARRSSTVPREVKTCGGARWCGIHNPVPPSLHFRVVSQVGAFLSAAAGCVAVGPASDPDPPVVEISAPEVVGCCDGLVLEGIASYPSTGIGDVSTVCLPYKRSCSDHSVDAQAVFIGLVPSRKTGTEKIEPFQAQASFRCRNFWFYLST